ncbi:hypothetical protein BCR41DRAFT_355044 [Lobosporangium transversale]|uniref:DUF1640-domain-containing protein n=2 Tax=Mortierellaceae TaxID=4854 RepID=A0A1Y2GMV5_9FUNG|nr:hypothetical protein BCR41DRAFT_355044 [Lobosporangium transversale]ORZ13830.1 hypothetical protein BCR41DRAFT_355044 [Lobosporangium transversale]|eukprot:XP_021880614.1 hypothetical protein BCR41DRAFT_355044 [Lobosporangium transversale]
MINRLSAQNILSNVSKLVQSQAQVQIACTKLVASRIIAPSRSITSAAYLGQSISKGSQQQQQQCLIHRHRYSTRFKLSLSSQKELCRDSGLTTSVTDGVSLSSTFAFPRSIVPIRAFSTSGPALDDGGGHHFDTHRFVEKLEREGFSRQQSEAIMNALDEVITESMNNLTKNMVTKADQDKTVYTYKVDFAALKSELQMLEKNDFSLTNTNNERLVSEIEKLRQRLREEVARTQAGVRLDLNLEKGRIRDEAATQELKVRATEERIEQEIAALRTQMETIKLQTLQYMIGTITGAGALILAYLRMFK